MFQGILEVGKFAFWNSKRKHNKHVKDKHVIIQYKSGNTDSPHVVRF